MHYEHTVRGSLMRTPTLEIATEILLHRAPRPPFLPTAADPVWKLIRPAAGHLAAVLGFGIMHPEVRAIVPMTWTAYHQVGARASILLLRWIFRVMPTAATDTPLARNRRQYRHLIGRYRRQTSA
ncbi:hypothetical protein [Nocardia sp. XZ_19_385]|uniref:hypothetical protein n=2 Tax=Nocardia sp. XZ_19_385 TaxID=2769488 RepID=UPI001890450C|nr:hypothetical protein [Nocardia sp. XZ_19_385]